MALKRAEKRAAKKPDEGRRPTEVRKVELTDAALHVIATRGIAALTTRSLAEHVGLSSGAIFRHFATLDALLDAVVARVEAELDATYPSKELPPLERLERFVEARSATVGNHTGDPSIGPLGAIPARAPRGRDASGSRVA